MIKQIIYCKKCRERIFYDNRKFTNREQEGICNKCFKKVKQESNMKTKLKKNDILKRIERLEKQNEIETQKMTSLEDLIDIIRKRIEILKIESEDTYLPSEFKQEKIEKIELLEKIIRALSDY